MSFDYTSRGYDRSVELSDTLRDIITQRSPLPSGVTITVATKPEPPVEMWLGVYEYEGQTYGLPVQVNDPTHRDTMLSFLADRLIILLEEHGLIDCAPLPEFTILPGEVVAEMARAVPRKGERGEPEHN